MIVPAANPAGGAELSPPPMVDPNAPKLEGQIDLQGTFARNAQKLEFDTEWALADFGLQPGDVVEYWAEAFDYCPTDRKRDEPPDFSATGLSPEETAPQTGHRTAAADRRFETHHPESGS